MNDMVTKPVPYDLGAEESVLGSLILDRDSIVKVAGSLHPQDFYHDKHGYVYQAVLTLYERREPPDPVTLASELNRVGRLDSVGGHAFLIDLVNRTPTAVHIEHYARIVRRASFLRRLISAGGRIAAEGYGDYEDEATALANAEHILAELAGTRRVRGYAGMEALVTEWGERLERLQNSEGHLVGVASGYSDLDEITGGWQEGELIIFGARPGNGKTAILVDQTLYMAKHGERVGIFSLEMTRIGLTERMIANESRVDSHKLRQGTYLSEHEIQCINHAQGRVAPLPIYIDETTGISINELRAQAHRMKAEQGISVLMVDYLQKITNPRKDGNRINEVGEVARKLKDLARELRIPVLVPAQLSREHETRAGHEPQLHDLADSSEIEKEADVVILMHRPELYERKAENAGIVKLKVAKHRSAPSGNSIPLRFVAKWSHFQNLAGHVSGAWGSDEE